MTWSEPSHFLKPEEFLDVYPWWSYKIRSDEIICLTQQEPALPLLLRSGRPTVCVYTQTPGIMSHTPRIVVEGYKNMLRGTMYNINHNEAEADSNSHGEGECEIMPTGSLTAARKSSVLAQTAFSRPLIAVLLKHCFKCDYCLLSIQPHNVNVKFVSWEDTNKWRLWFVIQSCQPLFHKRDFVKQQRKSSTKQKKTK